MGASGEGDAALGVGRGGQVLVAREGDLDVLKPVETGSSNAVREAVEFAQGRKSKSVEAVEAVRADEEEAFGDLQGAQDLARVLAVLVQADLALVAPVEDVLEAAALAELSVRREGGGRDVGVQTGEAVDELAFLVEPELEDFRLDGRGQAFEGEGSVWDEGGRAGWSVGWGVGSGSSIRNRSRHGSRLAWTVEPDVGMNALEEHAHVLLLVALLPSLIPQVVGGVLEVLAELDGPCLYNNRSATIHNPMLMGVQETYPLRMFARPTL